MLIFISLDIVMVVLESDNEWRIYLGDASFANLEGVAAFVFSFLYVLRFIAAPYDRRANYSRWGYLTSFFGVADAIAFLPFFMELYWTAHGIPYDSCFFCAFFFPVYWTAHGILYSMYDFALSRMLGLWRWSFVVLVPALFSEASTLTFLPFWVFLWVRRCLVARVFGV
jgi:hypothetical protein